MKNFSLSALAWMALLYAAANAQPVSVWKHVLRPDWGIDLHMYSIADSANTPSSDIERRTDIVSLGMSGGLNLPFVPLGENLSIGLNPNAGIALALTNVSFGLDFPVYATIKYGTDATWAGSKSYIGATAGIGYNYTMLFLFTNRVSGTVVNYGLPSVMAELSIGKRRSSLGLIKLRYTASLGTHVEEFTENGEVIGTMAIKQHAFHLLFTPAY